MIYVNFGTERATIIAVFIGEGIIIRVACYLAVKDFSTGFDYEIPHDT